jgi:hypothetical protein
MQGFASHRGFAGMSWLTNGLNGLATIMTFLSMSPSTATRCVSQVRREQFGEQYLVDAYGIADRA